MKKLFDIVGATLIIIFLLLAVMSVGLSLYNNYLSLSGRKTINTTITIDKQFDCTEMDDGEMKCKRVRGGKE